MSIFSNVKKAATGPLPEFRERGKSLPKPTGTLITRESSSRREEDYVDELRALLDDAVRVR